MNLALPAIILLGIALPGFIFVYTYKGSLRNYNEPLVSASSMSIGWVLGFILGFASHAIWGYLLTSFFNYKIDLDAVVYFLSGNYDNRKEYGAAAKAFSDHPYAVAGYFSSLYLCAALVGMGAHKLVRKLELDHKIGLLKFNNPWHYLFWGDGIKADGVWLTVTVKHCDHSCLYAGMLTNYMIQGDGTLERLEIGAPVFRIRLQEDQTDGEELEIPGDRMLIWCRDVNTLNVDYVYTLNADESIDHQNTLPRPPPSHIDQTAAR